MSEQQFTKFTKKKFKDLNIHFKMAYILAGAATVSGVGGAIDMLFNSINYGMNYIPETEAFYAKVLSSEEYQQYISDITDDLYQQYKAGKISYIDFNNQVAELKESHRISEYIKNSDNEEWHQGLNGIKQGEVEFEDRIRRDAIAVGAFFPICAVGVAATAIGTMVDWRQKNQSHDDMSSGR
jgi:hypothetical protein